MIAELFSAFLYNKRCNAYMEKEAQAMAKKKQQGNGSGTVAGTEVPWTERSRRADGQVRRQMRLRS
jgi:hypothetical protein